MSFFKKLQNLRLEGEEKPEVNPEDDQFEGADTADHQDWLDAGVSKPRPYRPAAGADPAGSDDSGRGPRTVRPSFRQEKESNAEFNKALEEILWVIKESVTVRTVSLFWLNRNRKQFILESCVTDSPVFTREERLEFNEDSFLQAVADSRKPVSRNRIPGSEVMSRLPYYFQPEKINAFLGVPVFFGEEICAVLSADSLRPDAFTADELTLFNRLARLVSHLVYIYSLKDDLEFTSRYTSGNGQFQETLKTTRSPQEVVEALAEFIQGTFEFTWFAFAAFDREGDLTVQKSVSRSETPYIPEGTAVSVDHSLAGAVMRSLKPMVLKSTGAALEGRYRFNPSEELTGNNSLVAVPVYSSKTCYGAMILEHEIKGWYTASHLQALEQTGFLTGLILENLFREELSDTQKVYDDATGVFDRRFFFDRVSAELSRAVRVGFELCLVVFEIDRFKEHEERYGLLVADMAGTHLARLLKLNLRQYDYLGRLDRNRFAALMVHSDATNAFLISEKIRESVASSPIRFERLELPVTISIGISRLNKAKATADNLLDTAMAALQRARETGGNNVKTN
ncbi:MAG: sensor domain-containing diguanylate cyclase [Bacteroidetes bacterium]|nr:sensor domain-containing diguanylate cyclase [Bacteroidota bacterium]